MLEELIKTKDIAKELGKRKNNGKVLVGFALETENGIQNAKKKIQKKGSEEGGERNGAGYLSSLLKTFPLPTLLISGVLFGIGICVGIRA